MDMEVNLQHTLLFLNLASIQAAQRRQWAYHLPKAARQVLL
jgi:hypothetical protein